MNNYNKNQAAIGEQILNSLYQNSWNSPEFKDRLIRNPSNTIEEVLGHKIPINSRFVVEDQSDETVIYLNIPRKLDIDTLELTDEQLEMVAGGTDFMVGLGYAAVVGACALVAYGVGYYVGNATNTPPASSPPPKK
jgi:hypothetical protein